MKKLHIGFMVFCLLSLLMIPVVSASTTFNEAEINSNRTGLQIDIEGNTFVFWHISEVVNSEVKINYALNSASVTSEGLKTINGEECYQISYSGVAKVTISNLVDGISIQFTSLFSQKYSDSVITVVYELNGIGDSLILPEARIGTFEGSLLIIVESATPVSVLDQLVEWLNNLF